jgi:outer membrane protein
MNQVVPAGLRLLRYRVTRSKLLGPWLAALGAIGAATESASAQTAFTLPAPPFELPMVPSASGNWTVMVGVGGEYKPDFEGANRSIFSPVPIFSIRRAGSTEQFRGPRDSASIALIDFGDLRAGPTGKFVSSRKAANYSELNGLGDVKSAFELGGFVEYYPVDWFRARVELREGVVGHRGTVADFSGDFIVPVIQWLTSRSVRASHGKIPRRPRPILASTPCRRWLQDCRSSMPKAERIHTARVRRCPIGSVRNGKFILMSSTSGCSATRRIALW